MDTMLHDLGPDTIMGWLAKVATELLLAKFK